MELFPAGPLHIAALTQEQQEGNIYTDSRDDREQEEGEQGHEAAAEKHLR